MKHFTCILALLVTAVIQGTAGTITYKKVDFNDEGIPSKIVFVFRGSFAQKEHPPAIVAIQPEPGIIHYRGGKGGYDTEKIKRIGDDYEIEISIVLEDYDDILGRFKRSDWSLALSDNPKPKNYGGEQENGGIALIKVLVIKDIIIGLDMTHVKKEAEQAAPCQPLPAVQFR